MSPAKTVDEMAIATEATIGHFLAEFSFVAGRLLKVTLHALLEVDAPAWGDPRSSDRRPSTPRRREPLFDVHPRTGATIEVFYADRTLETFGRGGAGWFWWARRRGSAPEGPARGPFATSYAAFRGAFLGAADGSFKNCVTNQEDIAISWRRER